MSLAEYAELEEDVGLWWCPPPGREHRKAPSSTDAGALYCLCQTALLMRSRASASRFSHYRGE